MKSDLQHDFFTEAQEAARKLMPDAKTDEPSNQAVTTVPVNYTEGNMTTDRLVEMTDDSEHDSDLGSSSHKPLEGIMDTQINRATERPLDTIKAPIHDVDIAIKPTMNSSNETNSSNYTNQKITTISQSETATKDFTKAEATTIRLSPMTKNDPIITESLETSTINPRLSVTTKNPISDTKTEVYKTETDLTEAWANQGK